MTLKDIDEMLTDIFGRPIFYILEGENPRPATFREIAARGAAAAPIACDVAGGQCISTVFLGMDVAAGFNDRPRLLFETLITPAGCIRRYGTLAEALAGHAAAVELARQGKDPLS